MYLRNKKIVSSLVCFMMVISLFMPFNSFATEEKQTLTGTTKEVVKEVKTKEDILKEDIEKYLEKGNFKYNDSTKVMNAIKKEIDFISINDFHGNVKEDAREKGKNMGMSKVINAVKTYKQENPNTIPVSAGDSYQGTAMSNLTYGAPVSKMYNEIGIIASAIGNHEFDWGTKWMDGWAKDGNFEFLASNIVDAKTLKPVKFANPYKVIEQDGIKIGLIGLTTPQTAFQTLPEYVKDYKFTDVKEAATKWAKYLKSGEAKEGKMDLVIALTHIGSYQNYETGEVSGEVVDRGLCEIAELDAIISAHTHQSVAGFVNKKPIVQGYKYGRALGKLTILFDENNEVLGMIPKVDTLYKRKSELIADANGDKIYKEFDEKLKPILSEIVGSTKEELSHERHSDKGTTLLGNLVSEIIREKADVQIGLMNEGGLRTSIAKGDITIGNLYEVLPFDNTLVSMDITGEQLKKVIENGINNPQIGWVEVAGLKVNYDLSKEFGNRVIDMYLLDGSKIEMDKTYSVCTNDFMASGGDKYDFKDATNFNDTKMTIRDVVKDYIKEMKIIDYKFEQPLNNVAKETEVKEAA
ncbi:MAG: 5'-nucleotidase C-terminal domain-containing protein [Peptostreptococcaceae bacterium]|jgi:2',3'-cyclic-nucleotide 2'-phosphodiesterase/3'-nucleotidase|nr:5'-nucleotidase C-terminal domain-containing protein [Peptostreptococcaceae bacterium]